MPDFRSKTPALGPLVCRFSVWHELVTRAEAWPGVGSIEQIRVFGREENCREGILALPQVPPDPPPRSVAMVEYSVDLLVPRSIPGENEAERRQTMLEAIEERRKKFCKRAGLDRHRRPNDPEQ